jgi:hypothetical protein
MQQLYEPWLVIMALNFIVENQDECAKYRGMQPWEGGRGIRSGCASSLLSVVALLFIIQSPIVMI